MLISPQAPSVEESTVTACSPKTWFKFLMESLSIDTMASLANNSPVEAAVSLVEAAVSEVTLALRSLILRYEKVTLFNDGSVILSNAGNLKTVSPSYFVSRICQFVESSGTHRTVSPDSALLVWLDIAQFAIASGGLPSLSSTSFNTEPDLQLSITFSADQSKAAEEVGDLVSRAPTDAERVEFEGLKRNLSETNDIAVGDTVRLKSGGPLMTVLGFSTGASMADVMWFSNDNEGHSLTVSTSALLREEK